ncbi:MAG: hypothetical protein KAT32_02240 [Candidatus Moranbacteria bacterium]|nr:hypothetical protein [Candidatus Moranbacteria bacterium]
MSEIKRVLGNPDIIFRKMIKEKGHERLIKLAIVTWCPNEAAKPVEFQYQIVGVADEERNSISLKGRLVDNYDLAEHQGTKAFKAIELALINS